MLEPIDFSATFSEEDLKRLERARLDRLTQTIEPLRRAIVLLDLNYTFNIYCTNPAQVDELLQWDIGQAAQIILGCQTINILFANEIVWTSSETELCFISDLDVEFTRDNDMGSTVLEREVIGAEVKSQVAEAIAPAIDQLVEQELTHFASNGEMASLIRDRVQERVSNWVKSLQTQATETPKSAEVPQATTTPTAEAAFKIAPSYGDTLNNALMALIPEPSDRTAMLKAIEKKLKKGIAFIDNQVLPHYSEQQQGRAKEGLMKQSTIDRARQRLVKAK